MSMANSMFEVVDGNAENVASSPDTIEISSDLVVLSEPDATAAESIRQLRTRLIAQHIDRGRRTLVLCSPTPNSGCSFIAANLAVAFAQIGTRVLLVNADFREGGFDSYFGEIGEGAGLLQELSENTIQEKHAPAKILPSLWVLPSGGTSGDASELLSTARFKAFLDEAVRDFDLVLIDTPPANLYADAQRVARVAGYCAIVARTDKSYFNDISELARQLQADGVAIIGTILNQH